MLALELGCGLSFAFLAVFKVMQLSTSPGKKKNSTIATDLRLMALPAEARDPCE